MDTTRFKTALQEEKVRLESEMGGLGRKNIGVPDDWEPVPTETGAQADLADQADNLESRDNSSAIFADLEARYDMVLAAQRNMDKGTYGLCEVCGKPIEEARLAADAAATTCLEHV